MWIHIFFCDMRSRFEKKSHSKKIKIKKIRDRVRGIRVDARTREKGSKEDRKERRGNLKNVLRKKKKENFPTVYVYIYIYVRSRVCLFVCAYVCAHVCAHVCVCIHLPQETSSLLSLQSGTPSHFLDKSIHIPLLHWNWWEPQLAEKF